MTTIILSWRLPVVKQPSRGQHLDAMCDKGPNFVQSIEKHACLYDHSCAEYTRKDVTEKAWSEIANEMNWTVRTCKDKWRNIRNGFVRTIRTKGGSGAKTKKPYYLHEEMQFLVPYIKALVQTDSNVTLNSDDTQEEDEHELDETETPEANTKEDNVIQQPSSTPQAGSVASNNEQRGKKRRAEVDPDDKTLIDYIKNIQENLDRSNPEEDARKMFLLSLLPDVNQLSDAGFRQFKVKSLMLVDELLSSGYEA